MAGACRRSVDARGSEQLCLPLFDVNLIVTIFEESVLTPSIHHRLMRHAGPAVEVAERRAFQRVRVDCPARLETAGSYRSVHLCDLSRSGARVLLDDPPVEGTIALLRWQTHESLCTIVWASDVACGVNFHSVLPEGAIAEGSAAQDEAGVRPVAGITKIEFGKSRRARLGRAEPHQPIAKVAIRVWSIVLPRKPDGLRRGSMTPVEEMFFFGSPVAHIVQYRAESCS